jgi:hypothetical protein
MRIGGGGLVWKRRGREDRNPMERVRYPKGEGRGDGWQTRREMPTKANDRRRGRGVDGQPKNESGRTGAIPR